MQFKSVAVTGRSHAHMQNAHTIRSKPGQMSVVNKNHNDLINHGTDFLFIALLSLFLPFSVSVSVCCARSTLKNCKRDIVCFESIEMTTKT